MSCETEDLVIRRGATFTRVVRWESTPLVYKAITGITKAAPAVVTATGHGVPDGWRVAIVSAGGMREINAKHNPPWDGEFRRATVLTSDTISLNEVNSAGFTTYTSGGYVQYYTPIDLTGYTARMKIKDRVGGTVLISLATGGSGIVVDNSAKTITITIAASVTELATWTEGVYDLEMVSSDVVPVVTELLAGTVTVSDEVTT